MDYLAVVINILLTGSPIDDLAHCPQPLSLYL